MTTAVATRLSVELLHFPSEGGRAKLALDAMARGALGSDSVHLASTQIYRGGADILLIWGPGGPDRVEPMRRQIAAGGHVIALDLAYWQRDQKFRISLDAAHPQQWVMRRSWSAARFQADGVAVENAWDPKGPVIVAGIGAKATVQYGAAVQAWELEILREARARGRAVAYRPKKDGAVPTGVPAAPRGPIDSVLRGASLVCTWHSNVAIDAIRLGIPVVCRDGAAAAVCPPSWQDPRPLPAEIRDQFLANLAWLQWRHDETTTTWRFIRAELA